MGGHTLRYDERKASGLKLAGLKVVHSAVYVLGSYKGRNHAMEHVRLGRTGLQVSRLCLGTMTFGLQCDEPGSVAIMDRAAEGGITFFDTADVYRSAAISRLGAPKRLWGAG